MKASSASLLLSLLGFSAGCSDLATAVDPTPMAGASNGGSGGQPGHGGASGTDGSPQGGTSAHAGAGGTTSHAGSIGDGDGGDAGATGSSVLALDSVEAHVVGRDGTAIRFTIKGTKPATGATHSIAVTFEDGDGMPVAQFDGDWDGSLEATEGRIVFDAPVSEESFTTTATLSGIKDVSKLLKAKVALVDGSEQLSNEVEATIDAQALLKAGDACDKANVKDRCDSGQSCSGTPAKCSAGVAPVMVELKYLKATDGPLILARGTDPDDDVSTLHVELLDAANKPVTIDLDTNPTSTIDTSPTKLSNLGAFFGMIKGTKPLEMVPRVRVTPGDALGHQGLPMSANLASVARAGDGGSCDTRGFTGCMDGSLCVATLPATAGKCVKAETAHAAECMAASKLDPEAGVTTAAGRMNGVSLWDPPLGCTNPENTGRPEGVVSLHLGQDVKTLTISTQRPETDIDTVLYVLPGCAEDTSTALDCNDDDGGYASSVTLSDVPAGDYLIIVESGQLAGGSFGVSVSVQ